MALLPSSFRELWQRKWNEWCAGKSLKGGNRDTHLEARREKIKTQREGGNENSLVWQ